MAKRYVKNPTVVEALRLREAGVSVVPVYKKGGAVAWKTYQTEIMPEAKVRSTWGVKSPPGLAVVCGPVSGGLVGLDIDNRELADRLLPELDQLTQVVKTPHGLHAHFLAGDDVPTAIGWADNVDLKGSGLLVVPPTEGYEAVNERELLRAPDLSRFLAGWLDMRGVKTGEAGERQPVDLADEEPVPVSMRDDYLARAAGVLRRVGMRGSTLEAALLGLNSGRLVSPLDDERVIGLAHRISDKTPAAVTVRDVAEVTEWSLDTEPAAPLRWLIADILPDEVVSIFYGSGSSGKSFIALKMMACLVTGQPFLGLPVERTNVLYLDWERWEEFQRRRIIPIVRAMGYGKGVPPGITYMQMRGPLTDDKVRNVIAERAAMSGAGLIVVDSLGRAAYGLNLDSAGDMIRVLDALITFDLPVLAVDHQAKTQFGESARNKTVFGSVYKENLAANVWQAQRMGGGYDYMDITLRQTKENLNVRLPELQVKMTMGPDPRHPEVVDFTIEGDAQSDVVEALRAFRRAGATDKVDKQRLAETTGLPALKVFEILRMEIEAGRIKERGGPTGLWYELTEEYE